MFEGAGVKMHKDRFYGPYRAFVKDNRDPLKLNRIKVICPSILGEDEEGMDVESNWAYPMSFIGGGKNFGVSGVPPVVDESGNAVMVWIFFEMGDVNNPVWLGSPFGETGGESDVPEVCRFKEDGSERDEPNNFAFVTPTGHIIELDDEPDHPKIKLTDIAGNIVRLDAKLGSEHILIQSSQGSTIKIDSDIRMEAKGNCYIDANQIRFYE